MCPGPRPDRFLFNMFNDGSAVRSSPAVFPAPFTMQVHLVVNGRIISDGLRYALVTGNWGDQKKAHQARAGVSQVNVWVRAGVSQVNVWVRAQECRG